MKKCCCKGRISVKGFTLIEILVVVVIIAVLAAVALPQYQKAVDRSAATQMFVTGKAIKDAQELYYLDNGKYADSLDKLDLGFANRSIVSLKKCTTGIPASVYVYHPKLTGTFIIFGYAHQCASNGWKNRRNCYAASTNKRGNRLCSLLTNIPIKSGCGQYCTYHF